MTTTYKPPFNPNLPKAPQAPRAQFVPIREAPKISNPENTIRIFDIMMNGNINDIKNVISTSNTPLNIKNVDNKSLIHFTLENRFGMNEDDKLELIKYLLDHGAGLSFDKYNVCPLHLACKYQYKKIVEFLLNFGNVNVSDSNGMNALHYLVQGDISECKMNNKSKGLLDNDDNEIKVRQNLYPIDMVEKEQTKHQYRIYDDDPNITKNVTVYKCYNVNCDILDLLYNNFVNMNKKDITGASPLFYAMEMNNVKLIQKLLSYPIVSIINESGKNNLGITPYKHYINLYKTHVQYITFQQGHTIKQMLYKLTHAPYDELKNTIMATDKYKNTILKYMDIIFPQLIIMYNNMLYFYSKSYNNGWTHNEDESLKNLLFGSNLQDTQFKLPLLNAFRLVTLNKSLDFNNDIVMNQEKEQKIAKINGKIKTINNILESLKKEHDMYASLGPTYLHIKDQVKIKIDSVIKQKGDLENERLNLINDMNPIDMVSKENMFNDIENHINNLYNDTTYLQNNISVQHDKVYDNIKLIYDKVNKAVCNDIETCDDHILYNKLWRNLINDDGKLNNISNIHLKIVDVVIGLFEDMDKINQDNCKNAKGIHDKLIIVNAFCQKILVKTIDSMNELPRYYNYNENYVLTEVLDIMVHIVKHSLCSNLYYSVVKVMGKYYVNILKLKDVKKIEDEHVEYKKSDGIKKLHKYIIDDMPKKLVKCVLKVYENDEEPKIKMDDLFDFILKIISGGNKKILDDLIIKGLSVDIFDYYKNIMTTTIKLMEVVINNYNRFILNDCRFIEVATVLNEKVKKL